MKFKISSYNRFRQMYQVIVSFEFSGVRIYNVYRAERALKLAKKLEETITVSNVLSDAEIY